jgi:hypothetical protein
VETIGLCGEAGQIMDVILDVYGQAHYEIFHRQADT